MTNGARVYISSRDGKACEKAAAELTALGTCQAWGVLYTFELPAHHPFLWVDMVDARPVGLTPSHCPGSTILSSPPEPL